MKSVGAKMAAQFVGHHRRRGLDGADTDTRRPLRCTASTSRAESPSPENRITWSRCSAISSTSMARLDAMCPLILRRPHGIGLPVGLVTMV